MSARTPQRVLVIVTRRIGDVLLATPVFRSLRRAWPDATIDALVFRSTAAALAGNPDINQIHAIDERPTLTQHLVFIARLFRRYELAVSLVAGDRPTLYAFAAGQRRIGLLLPTQKEAWKRRFLNAWAPYDMTEKHTVLTQLSVLSLLNVKPIAELVAPMSEADHARADAALATLKGQRFVVLHPYPKFNYKTWSVEGWLVLAQWLTSKHLGIVLTGGGEATERAYVEVIAREIPGVLNLAGQVSLGVTTAIIARAVAYVGPDTATTHIAAALGVPMVTFFGPTDPLKWGPWPKGYPVGYQGHDGDDTSPWRRLGHQARGNIRLLQGAAMCAPCGHEGCKRHVESASDCLRTLPASRVIAALSEVAGIE